MTRSGLADAAAPLLVTMGDPAGIGPEVILRALQNPQAPAFTVLGCPDLFAARADLLDLPVSIEPVETLAPSRPGHLKILPLRNHPRGLAGMPERSDALATLEALERGADMVVRGEAPALVTAPISKKPLYEAGFPFPGHTEFLEDKARKAGFTKAKAVMMLAGPALSTVPVTVHVALSAVPGLVTQALIIETARIVCHDLKTRFGIEAPRLALAGLNPHAGEMGSMGREDEDVVKPAIAALRAEGIDALGPYPSDTMFAPRARKGYDAALCMYHDQALIPVKTIAFDETVNVTLGLPFVRTSPDHGTAYDIAGKGVARPESMIAALKLARRLADGGRSEP